ncbi:hypothetical protein [Pedobacter sp. ASV12]|uniref:hypothetical protein n=1 Tax=Pedobacter sp. ASV12 TaxID=2795120 RepID=UPI0018EBE20F|nr:hypothetical protein [Pedobacter sp. ASV12]
MEGLATEKAKLASQSNTVSPQHSTNGAYLVDNRPSSGHAVIQRVKGLEKGKHVQVNNGKVPWYGQIVDVKGDKYVIRLGGGGEHDLHEVAQEYVELHPIFAAMSKKRTLDLDGQHGTNSPGNVKSLAQGLDYQKQLAGGGDATQYSGPGFYYFPKTASMDKDAKGYGHSHKLDIYTTGLHAETQLNDDSSEVLRDSASLKTGLRGLQARTLELTSTNHPMNMWTHRDSDQGTEKVIRPHLYDRGELINALKVAAALPVAGHAKDYLDSRKKHDEEFSLRLNDEGTAYGNSEAPADDVEKMDLAGNHRFADWENENRPGHFIIEKKYGDLKMPYAVFKVLVNVAEFDFKARPHDPSKASVPQVMSVGDSLGESILPSKSELDAIIKAAVKANPNWYHADDHEK